MSIFSGKNLILVLFCSSLLMAAFSCKKNKDPENMQLMGAWVKSENHDSIYFYVDKIGSTLYVTSTVAKVKSLTGLIRYSASNSSGLAPIENNAFDIILEAGGPDGPTHIGGTFNPTSMVLTGNFQYYSLGDSLRTTYPFTISRP